MYAAGKMPDHVTRYNHKNPNRWLIQTEPVRRVSGWDVCSRVAVMMCVPPLIVAAVVILQGFRL